MQTLLEIANALVNLLRQVVPFFLLGTVTGALVQTYTSARVGTLLFGGSGLRPLVSAIGAGAILPGCSCTTMPMARGLKGTGSARLGTVAAFIFVSPLLSPITVALTWGVLGWQITAARIIASLAGALILGATILRFEPWFAAGETSPATRADDTCCGSESAECCSDAAEPEPQSTLWHNFRTILRQTTPYFLLGMVVAAALATLLPEDAVPALLGSSSGLLAYGLAVMVGIPLYVCEGEEVPLTFGLMAVGLGSGPALTFLLGSVGTCIPTALMAQAVIGKRATAFYLAFWAMFAVGAGLVFQSVWAG